MSSNFIQHSDKQVVPLIINGAPSLPLDPTRLIPVVHAATGETVHYAQGASTSAALAAADATVAASARWKASKHADRRAVILKAADLLEHKYADEIARRQVLETSCSETFAKFMPRLTVGVLREIAAAITGAVTGCIPPMEGEEYGLVMKEPIGAVLCIPPCT